MKQTRFNKIHHTLGAKMVEFAGYEMPVQYSSIISEHKAVRNSVGVFDVSHMGEIFISGEKALNFVQLITVNDASKLNPGKVQYSAMCYADGGIVDDLLVYKIADDNFMLVVNAANIEKDFNWMVENNEYSVEIKNRSDVYSLLAVQGPNSKNVIQNFLDDELNLEFYNFTQTRLANIDMIISRTGYTGELGYELYFTGDETDAEKVWNKIFEAGREYDIKPAGLAARDSLRLEMGFCLYGNDIDQTTNPIEAGLGWITKLKKDKFIGQDAIKKVKEEGIKKGLAAMVSGERIFPRKGYDIFSDGKKIGTLTSGTVSPVLEKPIALGYIDAEYKSVGTKVNIVIRNKEVPAEIVKLPFIEK
ncbi:MAG: glycine cleavage system aminomethyltransferase GcvT [Bacteroidetes bacterium]|nr:glycine cleavage system aminomethyltransferase GcvT [Bacteroidota bacterium]MCH8033535.1 glycine cleavage system aminomethyltransferase GcvT [Bacteroidota bacterium]